MAIAIKAENISKQYRLGYVGSGSLKDDARRWWARMRGKEDPLLTVGETNDRSTKGESDYVWALKDINFEIEQGDTVGIIGRNGAGKSTLLKILSKVTAPTTGNIKVKGRIASLLEVGTGFHGELTGRENIYLNGAIMGMRKHEITRKLDEIVDFAGVERYLDTPVKRYSSGMYVRLGFAVAAHLENEILIADEVLAVGDAEFQQKCLGKMGDVAKGEGRTVLFVSHNMSSIQTLCNSGLLLQDGYNLKTGKMFDVLGVYLKRSTFSEYYAKDQKLKNKIYVSTASIKQNKEINHKSILLKIDIFSNIQTKVAIDLIFETQYSSPVGFSSIGSLNYDEMYNLNIGYNQVVVEIKTDNLALGEYIISIDITEPNQQYYDRCPSCLKFEVIKSKEENNSLNQSWNYGCYNIPIKIL